MTLKRTGLQILAASLAAVFSQLPAYAVSETGFDAVYRSKILPFFSQGESVMFTGKSGVPIHAWKWVQPQERGALVILPGQGEPLAKYAELAYDLRDAGYSIYMIDHRGQGASGRIAKDPKVQFVREFSDYTDDVETFMAEVVDQIPHAKHFLLAHSMGGAIASEYLERHPGVFNAAVLSSPMLLIDTAPYSEKLALTIAAGASLLGKGEARSIGQHPFDPPLPIEQSRLTHSEARHTLFAQLLDQSPELEINGVSFGWVQKSLEGCMKIREHADQVTTPLLILQAAEDKIVKTEAQIEFCENAVSCQVDIFPGAFHEILMEKDSIRDRALFLITDFYQKVSATF